MVKGRDSFLFSADFRFTNGAVYYLVVATGFRAGSFHHILSNRSGRSMGELFYGPVLCMAFIILARFCFRARLCTSGGFCLRPFAPVVSIAIYIAVLRMASFANCFFSAGCRAAGVVFSFGHTTVVVRATVGVFAVSVGFPFVPCMSSFSFYCRLATGAAHHRSGAVAIICRAGVQTLITAL